MIDFCVFVCFVCLGSSPSPWWSLSWSVVSVFGLFSLCPLCLAFFLFVPFFSCWYFAWYNFLLVVVVFIFVFDRKRTTGTKCRPSRGCFWPLFLLVLSLFVVVLVVVGWSWSSVRGLLFRDQLAGQVFCTSSTKRSSLSKNRCVRYSRGCRSEKCSL